MGLDRTARMEESSFTAVAAQTEQTVLWMKVYLWTR